MILMAGGGVNITASSPIFSLFQYALADEMAGVFAPCVQVLNVFAVLGTGV